MAARGLTSYRRLGEKAKISHEAVRRVVLGMTSDDASIEAVARALSVDVELVREMRGEPAVDPGRWSPPPGSRLLTDDERAALSRLIGVMVAGRQRKDGEGDDQLGAPAITQPGPGGAPGHLSLVQDDPLAIKHPPADGWTKQTQHHLDVEHDVDGNEIADAARAGEPDAAPDTTTGQGSQDDGGMEPS